MMNDDGDLDSRLLSQVIEEGQNIASDASALRQKALDAGVPGIESAAADLSRTIWKRVLNDVRDKAKLPQRQFLDLVKQHASEVGKKYLDDSGRDNNTMKVVTFVNALTVREAERSIPSLRRGTGGCRGVF